MRRSASEAPSPNRKRKRSLSREPSLGPPPVVVFNSPGGRAFRRVLKEESLNDFKRSIRAKLRLPESVRLHLAETRDGRHIDLDDEDDFEAFQAAAEHEAQLEVEVEMDDGNSFRVESSKDSRTAEGPPKRLKAAKSKKKYLADSLQQASELRPQAESAVETFRGGSPPRGRSLHRPALDESKRKNKDKGKRSRSRTRASSPAPLLTQIMEELGAAPKKKVRSAKHALEDHLPAFSQGVASSSDQRSSDFPSTSANLAVWREESANEPAPKRKKRMDAAQGTKKKKTIFDDSATIKHIRTTERRGSEDESSRVAAETPETSTMSLPRSTKKKHKAVASQEAAVAAHSSDAEDNHSAKKHRKKKKRRKEGMADDIGSPPAESTGLGNSVSTCTPDSASKNRRHNPTPSAAEGLLSEPNSPMTRKVNEILGNYYNNKLRFSAATTPKHEHVEPSPPPGIEQHFRAATGSAPQQLGIVAESNMLQDGVDPKRRKKKKAKGGSEVKVLQTTKKTKQRHQDEPEWRGNKSPAAGSRTEVEHETGADSNSHSPPSLPQRQESPGVTLSALRCPSAEARLGSVCSVSPLMYSRNATGLPSSSVPLLPRSAVPTFADLDAVDLESLLRPSRAEQRKARTSLEVLLSRRDEEPGGGPAKDVDESTSQGSDSIRSSTPSDIRRRRKHNLRAPVSVRQGLRLASEDDTSDTPDGMPNATQTRSSPALESNWATLSPSQNLLALQTFPDMPRDRPPEESHGDLRPESEDLTATAVGEGDGASPNGTPRMQSAVVARGDQFRSVIDEAHTGHTAINGTGTAGTTPVEFFSDPSARLEDARTTQNTTNPWTTIPESTLSLSHRAQKPDREADIESIDEFCTQRHQPTLPSGTRLPAADNASALHSPIQPSSPWTPDSLPPLPSGTSPSLITNHHQSPDPTSNASPPSPRTPKVPTLKSQMMKYRNGQARVSSAKSSGPPVSVVLNADRPRQSMPALTRSVEPDSLKGTASSTKASEQQPRPSAHAASGKAEYPGIATQNDSTSLAIDGGPRDPLANGQHLDGAAGHPNGPGRGASVASTGTSTPGPTSGTAEGKMKWAASYLRNSGMTKNVLRDFFAHEGTPLGKKADTKEKLFLQAIELMKAHPIHYARLKNRFDDAVKTNKAQLRELPPPVVPLSPTRAKVTKPVSTDSSGDANHVDRSLSVQRSDSRAPSPLSDYGSEPEIRLSPPPASAPVKGPRASMPVPTRFPRSQPIRSSRSSVAPITSLRNMTQDYVRSAIKPPASTQVRGAAATRANYGQIMQEESDQDDEDESDGSSGVPRSSQIPADRLAGAGLVSTTLRSIRNSIFSSQ